MVNNYYRTPKNNAINNSPKPKAYDLTSSPLSLAQELSDMSTSLSKQFNEINNTLLKFKDNVNKIEINNSITATSSLSNISGYTLADETSDIFDDFEDYSFKTIDPSVLLNAKYFQNNMTEPYSFQLINFFIKLLQDNTASGSPIGLINYQTFRDSVCAKQISLNHDYTIIYFIESDNGETDINNNNYPNYMKHHYICLVDKVNFNIHIINPLNNYSVSNDVIKLKLLLDTSFKTNKYKIRISHVPISKNFFNSGSHTLLNIYSLMSDIKKFVNNFNLKGNDQFDFFIPDNDMIRQQSFTVLAYILQNAVNTPELAFFKVYNDYLRNLKI